MTETKRQRQRQAAVERWMGPRLRISGVPADLGWKEPPLYVHECHEALRDTLEPWIRGTTDIPILRRILTDRQMHLRGRVSMGKTLLAINRLMDHRTCNLATPIESKDGELHWLGWPIPFIAKVGGVGYYACKDRIDDIVNHFGMSRQQQTGTDAEGQQYGRPSIRHMFDEFFQSLGAKVWEAVSKAQKAAYKAWKEAREALDPVVQATKKLREKITAATENTERVRGRSPEMSALLYGMLQKILPGYRKPKPDTS